MSRNYRGSFVSTENQSNIILILIILYSVMDVQNGVCAYDELARNLLRAAIEEIATVQSGVAPFLGACTRCESEYNYEDGSCVCTPFCGSCAPECFNTNEPAGAACVMLNEDGTMQSKAMPIRTNGSIRPGHPDSHSPACGFSQSRPIHKSGGCYDALVTDVPTDLLQIIDMETGTFHCSVDLPDAPSVVVWVPHIGSDISARVMKMKKAGRIGAIIFHVLFMFVLILHFACGYMKIKHDESSK